MRARSKTSDFGLIGSEVDQYKLLWILWVVSDGARAANEELLPDPWAIITNASSFSGGARTPPSQHWTSK